MLDGARSDGARGLMEAGEPPRRGEAGVSSPSEDRIEGERGRSSVRTAAAAAPAMTTPAQGEQAAVRHKTSTRTLGTANPGRRWCLGGVGGTRGGSFRFVDVWAGCSPMAVLLPCTSPHPPTADRHRVGVRRARARVCPSARFLPIFRGARRPAAGRGARREGAGRFVSAPRRLTGSACCQELRKGRRGR
jgi:hypothetical protein